MIARAIHGLTNFYARPFFERLAIYGFIASFAVQIIFELIMGQWSYIQARNLQWIFYGLLALDYLVSHRKILPLRVYTTPLLLVAVLFFTMVAHGFVVGLYNGNSAFNVLNNMIPPLILGINILRMQSVREYDRPIDFGWLMRACTLLALGTTLMGLIGQAVLHLPTHPSMGSSRFFLPLAFAALFMMRPLPVWMIATTGIILTLNIPDINRTSLAFILLASTRYFGLQALRAPAQAILFACLAVFLCVVAWISVPEDSQVYARISGLQHLDLSARTGSVGERQAEWDAIQAKLKSKGATIEWLGLGFGGTFDVQLTQKYLRDYGHAHYAWGWFNLRFGKSGYIYMALMMAALAFNFWRHLRLAEPTALLVAHMCLMGLIFCFTHVNSVFLLSGLHFFYVVPKRIIDGNRRHSPIPYTAKIPT